MVAKSLILFVFGSRSKVQPNQGLSNRFVPDLYSPRCGIFRRVRKIKDLEALERRSQHSQHTDTYHCRGVSTDSPHAPNRAVRRHCCASNPWRAAPSIRTNLDFGSDNPTTGWFCSCGGSNHGFLWRSWVVPGAVIASANRAGSPCDAIGPRLPA